MPSAAEYRQRIAGYDWDDLERLWEDIIKGETPGWEAGKAMEYLVLRAFQLDGADVRWPYSVYDQEEEIEQIDGVVYADGLVGLIECKDERAKINIEPIAKLRNQLLRRPGAVIGMVFSRSGFTDPAITLARFVAPQTILLWDGLEIAYALRRRYLRQALSAKYRHCIEFGWPNYNILLEGL